MTTGTTLSRPKRSFRSLAIVAALLLPANAGAPVLAGEALVPEPVAIPQAPETTPLDLPSEVPPATATPLGHGMASYYGAELHGRRTASGQRFDMNAMTAAHRTLPFGSQVRVTNPANGKSVVVTINDRGPFSRGRLIDVSRAAATELGLIARGHGEVELELVAG